MKRITAISFALLVLSACTKKLEDLVEVKFSVPHTKQVNVQGLPGNPPIPSQGLTTSIPAIGVETKSEEYIKQYNTSSELITEAQLSEMKLEINTPSSQTFDMVDSLWLFVSATGLPEVQAAYYFDIPKGLRALDMITSDENLKDYFLRDSMYFRLQGHFYTAPDSATVFTITTKFDAVAKPLKK
ncbi:MAG: hypothetical protein H3C54_01790 [Taibaiella sp.]|nr:hypothetical protein [Taibaiella sp.]